MTKNKSTTVYQTIWRNKFLTSEAETMEEMGKILIDAGKTILEMHADGVELQDEDTLADDYAFFTTTDPIVAEKYGMEEDEEWDEDEEDAEDEDEDG